MEKFNRDKKKVDEDIGKLNTLYGCYSTLAFTLKMEFVSKITIFGLKMVVKSGLRKN